MISHYIFPAFFFLSTLLDFLSGNMTGNVACCFGSLPILLNILISYCNLESMNVRIVFYCLLLLSYFFKKDP